MSAIIKKMKCNPLFPMIVAGTSYTLLSATSGGCLYYYFTQIAGNDFWHWVLISYILMVANGISGFSEFFDEESFFPLRDLLDYCQLVLVLPCYAAQMWVKTEMGPPEIAAVHAGLGIIAALIYVTVECRRQDLTDLAMFANTFSLLCMAVLSGNPIGFLATLLLTTGYCIYKRQEDQCCLAPQDKFNLLMAGFAILSVLSFDDSILQSIQDSVKGVIDSIMGGGE